jgi:hypothetical protein
MAEEVASGSVRSSQGSHRRTPKNVSISSAHRARIARRCPTTAANIARNAAPAAALADRKVRHPPAGRHEAAPRSVRRARNTAAPADSAQKR